MLQIAIVVFREILEISLILGVLTAATKKIEGKSKWILSGLFIGIITSAVLAFFTDNISESLDGQGQEFFNGVILLSAATMISWTVLWMHKHAKTLSGEFREIGASIREGKKPLYFLTIVVFFSVLRESMEIVLFAYSYYLSNTSIADIIVGLSLGTFLGSIAGFALYLGLIKTFGKYFFLVTTWLLVFLSSGIAAQGIGFWINASLVPAFGNPIFDASNILSQTSFIGKFLHIFFGYIDRPSGMQLLVYFTNLLILVIGLKIIKKL